MPESEPENRKAFEISYGALQFPYSRNQLIISRKTICTPPWDMG